MTLATLYNTLQPLHFTPLQVRLRLHAPLTVRRFSGSALRGALGWALGRALREGVYRCPPTHALGDSSFERLWKPRISSQDGPKLNFAPHSRVPPPYLISPPGPQTYAEKSIYSFRIVLVGRVVQALPLWVAACERLARHRRLFHSGGQPGAPARLAEIRDLDGRLLFDGESQAFTSGFYEYGARRLTTLEALRTRPLGDDLLSLKLSFDTPTRLSRRKHERERLRSSGYKSDGQVEYIDHFHPSHFGVLVERLYHRLFVLTQLYCEDAVQAYPGRAELPALPATDITQQETSFETVILSRQGELQTLDALKGTVTFAGRLAPFYPLFALGEHLHVGKSTSAGFGRFSLCAEEFSGPDQA